MSSLVSSNPHLLIDDKGADCCSTASPMATNRVISGAPRTCSTAPGRRIQVDARGAVVTDRTVHHCRLLKYCEARSGSEHTVPWLRTNTEVRLASGSIWHHEWPPVLQIFMGLYSKPWAV